MSKIEELLGKTITKIKGLEIGSEGVRFYCADNTEYAMYHSQNCCESVSIEEIFGSVDDLIGTPVLTAEERTSSHNPEGVIKDYQDSFTWTFYEIATIKGSVTIRWYGESNGYYSESVDFEQIKRSLKNEND